MPIASQTDRVLERLRAGPLTQLQALTELGVMRLGARILELRERGHEIQTDTVEVATAISGKAAHVASYRLVERPSFQLAPPPSEQPRAAAYARAERNRCSRGRVAA